MSTTWNNIPKRASGYMTMFDDPIALFNDPIALFGGANASTVWTFINKTT